MSSKTAELRHTGTSGRRQAGISALLHAGRPGPSLPRGEVSMSQLGWDALCLTHRADIKDGRNAPESVVPREACAPWDSENQLRRVTPCRWHRFSSGAVFPWNDATELLLGDRKQALRVRCWEGPTPGRIGCSRVEKMDSLPLDSGRSTVPPSLIYRSRPTLPRVSHSMDASC